jgi:hypothetical protein
MSARAEKFFVGLSRLAGGPGFVLGLTDIHGFEKLPCKHAKA